MLEKSIAVLAATNPPEKKELRYPKPGDANARIVELENALGVAHNQPIFNPHRANKRIEHLESLLAEFGTQDKSVTPKAQSSNQPVKHPRLETVIDKPAARKVDPTGDKTTDAAVSASGSHSLREFRLKASQKHLATVVASLPAGLSRDSAQKNLDACIAELKYIQTPN